MSAGSHFRRPPSVLLAQLLFWLMGLLILGVQIALTHRKEGVDWPSDATAILLLVAGVSGLARRRAAVTYYMGGVAMVALTARAGLAAWTFSQLQHEDSHLPHVASGIGIMAILLAWLTWAYLFGKSSRAYFSL